MSFANSPTDHVRPKISAKEVAEAIENDKVTPDDLHKFEQKYNEHSVRGPVPKQVAIASLSRPYFSNVTLPVSWFTVVFD